MKRTKAKTKAPNLITKHIPADPLMAQAWVDCLRDTISDTEVLAAFHADTGSTCTPGRIPIDRMIDEASGRERECVEQSLAWLNENVWGEECMYAQVNYPRWPAPDRLGWHARLCGAA